jgi:ABC-type nitrate/sulfonate/bicarbonate transport system substrate-binding protein
MQRPITIVILVSLALLAVVAWSNLSFFAPAPRAAISIADVGRPSFSLVYIAAAKGFFREAGVDVQLLPVKSSADGLTLALEGKADLAHAFEISLIQNFLEGAPVVTIATLSSAQKNTGVVALKERGIQSAGDLKGKKIAVTNNSNGDFFLSLLLAGAGIQASSVTLVDLPAEKMDDALSQGTVDAVATWSPYLSQAETAAGEERVVVLYSDLYLQIALLAGDATRLREKKDAVIALLGALVRAEAFARARKDEAVEIVARHLKDFPQGRVREFWDEYALDVKLDNVALNLMNQKADWFRRAQAAASPAPDLRRMIATEYLRQAHPEAVTIRDIPGAS